MDPALNGKHNTASLYGSRSGPCRYIGQQFCRKWNGRAHGTPVAHPAPTRSPAAMKTLLLLIATVQFAACTPQKELPAATAPEARTPPSAATGKNATIGVIQKATTDDGCPWTIRIKEVDYLLDPTNLADEFMVDGLRVRFDYRILRRTNRCKEANPIEVVSMVKMK